MSEITRLSTARVDIYAHNDAWYWRIYNESGEVISSSQAGHDTKKECERNLRMTLQAIILQALKALDTIGPELRRMKPVVAGIIESAGAMLGALKEVGYINADGSLSDEAKALLEEEWREELRLKGVEIERSKALELPTATQHIPVQYEDKIEQITVRVK